MKEELNQHFRLSICIASFNRASFLAETIDSFIEEMTNEVELVFIDGASTDNTKEIIKGYQNRYPNIKYVQLPEKGGVDKDFDLAVQYANGEYCWLICDDDPLEKNSISRVLGKIKNEKYSLLIANASILDSHAAKTLNPQAFFLESDLKLEGNDLNGLVKCLGNHLTYIGCIIINRELWLERDRKEFYGYEFIHFAVIFQKPLPESILIMAKPLIKIRYGNAQWTERALHIWSKKWPELVWSMQLLSKESKQHLSRLDPLKSFRFLLLHRAKNNISFAKLKMINKINGTFAMLTSFLFCLIPNKLLRFILVSYMKRDHEKYAVSLYDLEWQNDK